MRRLLLACLTAVTVSASVLYAIAPDQKQKAKTDAEIRQILIQESIAHYSGSCPCPYSKDRAGHSCGKRSAYSKPGGASPLCYPDDVTAKMVADYRKRNGAPEN